MAVDVTAFAIAASVIDILTVIITLFRLAFRLKIQRFWWEDMWAAVAMIGAVVYAIGTLIYFQTNISEATSITFWISSYAFTSTIWSVRMSLLYSIVRIISPFTWVRTFTRAIGALFVVVWVSLLVLRTWWCMSHMEPKLERPTCVVLGSVAIFEVTANFAGDATLVTLSLRLLWRVKLPRRQRRMILSIFSSTAIMSMISLLRATAQVVYNEFHLIIYTDLELISCLVVCNLLVLVTYIFRVFLSSSESGSSSEDDDFTTPVSRTTQSLTTVDLDTPCQTTTGGTSHFSSFLPSPSRSAAL